MLFRSKTVRDWGKVELETTFRIAADDSEIHMLTRMTNKGKVALKGLMSGYVVWPDGGYLFGVPGLPGVSASAEDEALADWSAAYDEGWVLGLHAPFSEYVAYNGRDRYLKHDLRPGESRLFEAWLQIGGEGSLAPLVQSEIDRRGLRFGTIHGQVRGSGSAPVKRPAVVVLKNGKPYSWVLGNEDGYAMTLPPGDYDLYAVARGYGQGKTQHVRIAGGEQKKINFSDVRAPGRVKFAVSGTDGQHALDARITIKSGYEPLLGYFGKNRYFTDLTQVGEISFMIVPGDYTFEISAGGGFVSLPASVGVTVESGQTREIRTAITVMAKPREQGWYSADLHHHSDVLDGFTEPKFVMRSELAAGLDIAFLSDHDSVVNNSAMLVLADERDTYFIPGTELSPSWAHFNAYPLDDGKSVDIDTGQASVQEIFEAARSMGADIVEVNHPYSDYGYFHNLEQPGATEENAQDRVPGGYDSGFDLIEITAGDNTRTMQRVFKLWNAGQRKYLAAGSDTHDVWHQDSGAARTFVQVEGQLTIDAFITSLKAGRAYASQGPVVYPEIVFGSDIRQKAGDKLSLRYSVQAVSGLRRVRLIERGTEIKSIDFEGEADPAAVDFPVHPEQDTWYSLVIEDANGKFAFTNPVWVSVAK